MNTNQQIYIVKPTGFDSIEEIFAVFNERERAEAFIDRFRVNTELEILDQEINPAFISDSNRSPYYISLGKHDIVPRDIFVSDLISQAEAAMLEEYSINFFAESTINEGLFNVMLFAENETVALIKALDIRHNAIFKGEWEQAWHDHHLKKLLQERQNSIKANEQFSNQNIQGTRRPG